MKLANYFPYNSWRAVLEREFDQPYWARLEYHLNEEGAGSWSPYPAHIFRAFELTPHSKVRIVILGQDPYQRMGFANGLAFSVNRGLSPKNFPPSLKNILQEAGIRQPATGDLSTWAQQGVLLLNTALTVSNGKAGSHLDLWQPFTDAVIRSLQHDDSKVYMLWGNKALEKRALITHSAGIYKAAHPCRASANRGFFGCKHFDKVNEFFESRLLPKIDWNPAP